MKNGIPDVGIPPLDPLNLDNVALTMAGAQVEFMDITMTGLSDHTIKSVQYDDNNRFSSL